MQYVIYGVFIFWFACSIWPLIVVAQRLFWPEPDPEKRVRPTAYYLLSFVFGIAVTGGLLWLYSSGYLSEWATVIIGWLVFLPESIYILWSQGALGNRSR